MKCHGHDFTRQRHVVCRRRLGAGALPLHFTNGNRCAGWWLSATRRQERRGEDDECEESGRACHVALGLAIRKWGCWGGDYDALPVGHHPSQAALSRTVTAPSDHQSLNWVVTNGERYADSRLDQDESIHEGGWSA